MDQFVEHADTGVSTNSNDMWIQAREDGLRGAEPGWQPTRPLRLGLLPLPHEQTSLTLLKGKLPAPH